VKIRFLGTGTSHGVPMIGCDCAVCRSSDPRNRRTRSSALLTLSGHQVLIDATAELRMQSLAFGIRRIDAVLLTHAHADHVSGLDDLRGFTVWRPDAIPVYCSAETGAAIQRQFGYIFDGEPYPGKPNLDLHLIDGPLSLFNHAIHPLTVPHGARLNVTAFRIGRLGYVTDASAVPDAVRSHLHGLDLLVLNALRFRPHPAHMCVDEAVAVACAVRPKRTLLTHIAHDLDHEAVNALLPGTVELAYDGLEIELPDD
jgi:phosphoribosyl 1,2-cyclic phosphate phosphodiesterase